MQAYKTYQTGQISIIQTTTRLPIRPNKHIHYDYYLQLLSNYGQHTSINLSHQQQTNFQYYYQPPQELQWPNLHEVHNLEVFPYSAIGQVRIQSKHNNNTLIVGIGCLIGPRIVLTNIYSTCLSPDNWQVQFIPACMLKYTSFGFKAKTFYNKKVIDSNNQQSYSYFGLIELDTQHNLEQYFGSLEYRFGIQQYWKKQSLKIQQDKNQFLLLENIRIVGYTKRYPNICIQYTGQISWKHQQFLQWDYSKIVQFTGALALQFDPKYRQYFIIGMINPNSNHFELLSKAKYNYFQTNFKRLVYEYSYSLKHLNSEEIKLAICEIQQNEKQAKDQHIITLYLNFNKPGNEGCKAIRYCKVLNKLYCLSLQNNELRFQCIKYLSQSIWTQSIVELVLDSNDFGNKGCKYLAQAKWNNLLILRLQSNRITDHGYHYLSKGKYINLHKLYLGFNKIKEEGYKYLTKWDCKNIKYLDLRNQQDNTIGWRELLKGEWPGITNFLIGTRLFFGKEVIASQYLNFAVD